MPTKRLQVLHIHKEASLGWYQSKCITISLDLSHELESVCFPVHITTPNSINLSHDQSTIHRQVSSGRTYNYYIAQKIFISRNTKL